jgi:hypothetical protein
VNSSLHVCEIQRLQQDLFDHIFLLRGDYLLTKSSLTPPQFIKMPVKSHQRERPCIYMLEVSILPLFLRLFDRILQLFWRYGVFWRRIDNTLVMRKGHEQTIIQNTTQKTKDRVILKYWGWVNVLRSTWVKTSVFVGFMLLDL